MNRDALCRSAGALVLRRRGNEAEAFLYAFDLIELDGQDLRREPIETRKATLASLLRRARPGVQLIFLAVGRPILVDIGMSTKRTHRA
jgi:ATP-dependent DNA ligase